MDCVEQVLRADVVRGDHIAPNMRIDAKDSSVLQLT